MSNHFVIVKAGAMYKVVGADSKIVMFSSMCRANCKDFIRENFPDEQERKT